MPVQTRRIPYKAESVGATDEPGNREQGYQFFMFANEKEPKNRKTSTNSPALIER